MLDRIDIAFEAALERAIRLVLDGDDKQDGLRRTILACPSWDSFNYTKGQITAYEEVLKLMHIVARRMNDGEEPVRMVTSRPYR